MSKEEITELRRLAAASAMVLPKLLDEVEKLQRQVTESSRVLLKVTNERDSLKKFVPFNYVSSDE